MTTPEPSPRCFGFALLPPKGSNDCLPPVLVTLMRTTDGLTCDATCAKVRDTVRASATCDGDGGGRSGLGAAGAANARAPATTLTASAPPTRKRLRFIHLLLENT